MTRRAVVELVVAVLAIGAIAVLATRDDGADESRAESKRGPAKNGNKPKREKAEVEAAPTRKELAASRKVQDRVALNTIAAENTLKVFGLKGTVEVRDEGRVVILTIAASSACNAVPEDEARIKRFLKDAQPSIRKVIIKVEGSDLSLSEYVRAHCRTPKFPGGPGKEVYRQKGKAFKTSKTFRIKKRRWAIDYSNEGARLLMLVFKKRGKGKDDKVMVPGIAKKKRGVGSQAFKGRGRYYIEIRGAGHWLVRVRDGA